MTIVKRTQPMGLLQKLLMDNEKYMKSRTNTRKKYPEQTAVFSQLYRYAEPRDIFLMIIGTLAAMLNGITLPLTSFIFGDLTNAFISQGKSAHNRNYHSESGGNGSIFNAYNSGSTIKEPPGNISGQDDFIAEQSFLDITNSFGLMYIYIGLFVCSLTFIQNACWEIACCNQIFKLRQVFFAQTMRQDVSWYDERENEDLTNKITDDMERMRDGLGSKVPVLFHAITLLLSGLVVGFTTSWKLTLVIMIGGPVLLISSAYTASIASGVAQREQMRYGIAGGIASEILTSLRTVSAFGGEKQEIERFSVAVDEGKKLTMKKYYFLSGGMAISMGLIYVLYGVGLWYGSTLFLNNEIKPGQIFTVFMSVVTGALGIGNSLPNVIEISTAVGAAATVFDIIDNIPKIDPYSKEGQSILSMKGEIEFKNVYFSYPMRPQVMVLSGLNLTIPAGKIVAVVGSSGAGKSTLVSLILRFYDPLCGKVSVDGVDISDLNIQNFRQQIGVVSQEPVLFDVTIEENIRYGKPSATKAEIEEAAKIAFAHTFIESLPSGYNTMVGERGVQLSGGQKQRIAIARAILRKPKILLLDEATSALDAHSETIVQAALENAAKGRTTLIIAHRLSTVKNADIIYAMKNGQLAESGTHEELMARKGIYYNLVLAQTKKTNESEEQEKEEEPVENPKEPIKRMLSFKRLTLKRLSSKVASESRFTEDKEVSYIKLLKVNDSPWSLIYAIMACFLTGFHIPAFAFLYGGILEIFTLAKEEFVKSVTLWCILFLVLAFFTAISMSSAVLSSSIVTENMIKDLRIKTFRNILSQQLSFFDEDKYSPIKLTNTLAKDPPLVKNIAGMRAGFIIITVVTTTLSMSIAFYCGWRIALIVLCFVPIIVFGNWIQMRLRFKSFVQECETTARVAKIASECLQNIKTVQFLCLQEHMLSIFMTELEKSHKDELKQGYIFASTFALVSGTVFLMYGCTFKFGSEFVIEGYMTGNDIYRTVFCLVFASTQLGSSILFFQDFGKAKVAISRVYNLMTLPTKLNIFSKEGEQPIIDGTIEFRDVYFSYPTRRHIQILQGLSLRVPQGMTVALVGGSGCGKSTLIGLLERFYNVKKGEILIDGVNIEKINVNYLRSQIGLVTQEPTLFDTTIRENICYGISNLRRNVTNQEIIDAAKAANIHEFIVNLPEGYETRVGERGSKLSGGQKQRIAIARALLRNPKILLLDEATSALDTESEKVVQDALDNARQGRTSIVIAHRLSTVKNADLIAVIADGRVVELGTHEKLIELKGHYYDLVKHQ